MTDVIVFIGIQGSGKGTQAKLLAKETGFQHINIGDLFREQIALATELGQQVKSIIARGELVSDELVFELVNSSLDPALSGIVFDGFPRTLPQAQYLTEHYNVKRVFYLELSEADAISRIEARRICSQCSEDFNLITHIPKQAGICDKCGGTLKQRADDIGEAIRQRVKEFYGQTFALKEHFAKTGLLVTISAAFSIDEIKRQILKDLSK
ncbi:MAG: nucleoside monophosphate kinase [Candidatus Cloacimonas sp.]|jgi:adenylate kinase|nr:nucleoside monophosphate kinase [Candidatus Cloacimonas sp.]